MSVITRLEKLSEIKDFIVDLNAELSNSIHELEHATPDDAIDICKAVAKRLNVYYQAI